MLSPSRASEDRGVRHKRVNRRLTPWRLNTLIHTLQSTRAPNSISFRQARRGITVILGPDESTTHILRAAPRCRSTHNAHAHICKWRKKEKARKRRECEILFSLYKRGEGRRKKKKNKKQNKKKAWDAREIGIRRPLHPALGAIPIAPTTVLNCGTWRGRPSCAPPSTAFDEGGTFVARASLRL